MIAEDNRTMCCSSFATHVVESLDPVQLLWERFVVQAVCYLEDNGLDFGTIQRVDSVLQCELDGVLQ